MINKRPANMKKIFEKDSLSLRPIKPIDVDIIRINGPTIANDAFKRSAFSTLFSLSIRTLADNSIHPEIILRSAIPSTNLLK